MKEFITNSAEQTISLAYRITKALPQQINTLILVGNISYGKTTFTKGVAKALEIDGIINSPTFTILKEYEGTKKLNHFDFYRLNEIGHDYDLSDYLNESDVINVIEWPMHVEELLPSVYVMVRFEYIDDLTRRIIVSTHNHSTDWEAKI